MKRTHVVVTVLALVAAAPHLVLILWGLLARLGADWAFRPLSGLPTVLSLGLIFPYFYAASLFSQMERYLAFSATAVALALAALLWLVLTEHRAALRRARFWALALALAAVFALPSLITYEPAVQTAPGWTLQMVERPGWLDGVVRACGAVAEIRGCQYEPLGWADEETLVYRKWCGGRFLVDLESATSEWDPGAAGPPLAYSVPTGRVAPFEGDVASLYRRTCDPNQCVTPGLVVQKGFPSPGYFSGHFGEPMLSPNGRRVAFTARHVYGPEDLLVLGGP